MTDNNEQNDLDHSFKKSRRIFVKKSVAAGAGIVFSSGILKLSGSTAYGAELEYDVVVVGSGAAGMTAALRAKKNGLKVLVVEKANKFGGSTARSGAGIWIRNNIVNQQAGIEDSYEEASEYLSHVAGSGSTPAKQEAYLRNGPTMISFIMENSPLRFRIMKGYSDYYPDFPGGKPEGASIEPEVFDGRLLGDELKNLNPPYIPTPAGVVVFGGDYKWLTLATVTLQGVATAAKSVKRYLAAKLKGDIPLTMGQALAAGLRAGLLNANVPVWLNTSLLDLSLDSNGRVNGVVVSKDGVNTLIKAKRGVIIASGGFEHNQEMRNRYQRQPIGTKWTLGAKENTGDGILAGQRIGADLKLMDDAWWGPSILLSPGQPYFCLSERSLPGSILVNADAERFVNESAPYHDVVNEMYEQPRDGADLPIFLITDQNYRNRYLFKDLLPGLPFPKEWYESGALVKAWSLSELAKKINLSATALEATIKQFNGYAKTGIDPDFDRGGNAYDRYYSDPGSKPNPSLGDISKPPYYAFKMVPGDLGTKGGLVTDERSRVLNSSGLHIKGLYAAGNSSNSVMGRSYAGAGSTIGPAMTFGMIAADEIMQNS